jgi:putative ABC transport system permease protein
MRSLVIGVSTHDPLTFGGTAAVLGAIALRASYIPAGRATCIDPLIALQTD